MLFVLSCYDRPGGAELRHRTREAHLAHLRARGEAVRVGGPLLDDEGRPIGSQLIVDLPDREAALAFLEADPYHRAGLFERISVTPYRAVLGSWLG